MKVAELVQGVGAWLNGAGSDADIVISSRVRIARNVGGFPFLTRASSAQRQELERLLSRTITSAPFAADMTYIRLDTASKLDALTLVERHLISRELATGEGERGVAFSRDETLSIMVNEEDHLRLQSIQPGLEPERAWEAVDRVEETLGRELRFAFEPDFGYLTACPTNVGTGLRASVMLHLPALAMSRHLEKVFNAMAKLDMVVRGLYGEGTEALGDIYQISNQKTLGKPETEIIINLKSISPQIVSYERKVREAMLQESRRQLEDQVFRAAGILRGARLISSEEALHLLSRLRLGVNLGIIKDVDIGTLNRLLILMRPAHVQQMVGRELDKEERDAVRADFLRQQLGGL